MSKPWAHARLLNDRVFECRIGAPAATLTAQLSREKALLAARLRFVEGSAVSCDLGESNLTLRLSILGMSLVHGAVFWYATWSIRQESAQCRYR